MSNKFARLALAAAVAFAVVGCNKEEAPGAAKPAAVAAAAATPDGVVMAQVQYLKAGNIDALIQNALPPGEYAKLKADFAKDINKDPITDEDRAKFTEQMTKLTGPDAEKQMWTELEPKLKEMDAQMAQQLPMMVAMGKGMISSSIQQNKDLTDSQKTQATQAIDAFGNWVQTVKWTDPALAQKAIGVVCDTARKVGLKTLDEARGLSYEQAMQKAGTVFLGVKSLLNVYGFSLDQTLDSIKAETLPGGSDAGTKVKVSYSLFNTPLSAESDLVKIEGRWYGKDMLEQLRKKEAEAAAPAAPAVAEPAPAPAPQG